MFDDCCEPLRSVERRHLSVSKRLNHMQTESSVDCRGIDGPLVRYYRDCLAAQMEWARAVNVLEQKDVFLVPVTAQEQTRLGAERSLALTTSEAIELAKRYTAGGSDVSLMLGCFISCGTPDRPW